MSKIANFKSNLNNLLTDLDIDTISEILKDHIYTHEILIWNNNYLFTNQILSQFPNLRIFINWGTNDNNIENEIELIKKGIIVKKVDYYATEALAEFITLLLLNFERHIYELKKGIKVKGREIFGKRVGILGLGKIGFRTGLILKEAYKCKIYYHSQVDKHIPGYIYVNLHELFNNCDYVIIATKAKSIKLDFESINNSNLVIVDITGNEVIAFEDVFKWLKSGRIRGYVADKRVPIYGKKIPPGALFFNHYGYLTNESCELKINILKYYLKKYYKKNQYHIYIARHGETKWNKYGLLQGRLDSPLTRKGKMHAKSVGTFLKDKKIEYVFTSPLKRARDTALEIAKETGAELITIQEFQEMSFGIFEGKYKKTNKRIFADFYKSKKENKYYKLFIPYPEGESYFDVYLRTLPMLLKILASNENFVIVGHESVNRILRGIINEYTFEKMIEIRQKNSELVDINVLNGTEDIINVDD